MLGRHLKARFLLYLISVITSTICFVTLLPILISVKGESGSLYAHDVPVLPSQTEIYSDMQALFTCTRMVSCASASSVLLDSWAQPSSTLS